MRDHHGSSNLLRAWFLRQLALAGIQLSLRCTIQERQRRLQVLAHSCCLPEKIKHSKLPQSQDDTLTVGLLEPLHGDIHDPLSPNGPQDDPSRPHETSVVSKQQTWPLSGRKVCQLQRAYKPEKDVPVQPCQARSQQWEQETQGQGSGRLMCTRHKPPH